MLYAIDRYSEGKEKEVSAKSFSGIFIPNKNNRFYCPECGEKVFFRMCGGAHPDMFYHAKKTPVTPECERRVDGKSGLSLYERTGLPLFLTVNGNACTLNLLFPPIGEKELLDLGKNDSYVIVSTNFGEERKTPINGTIFYSDKETLLPLNFLPVTEDVYHIRYLNGSYALRKKWSDYAEGFSMGGAIFEGSDTGGRKIKRNGSIVVGEEYYLVSRTFAPRFKEIKHEKISSMILSGQNYSVYKISVDIKEDNTQRYRTIAEYFQKVFRVGLLKKKPQLITLWPPIVETSDAVYAPINGEKKLYCVVSSGNEDPNVYEYKSIMANALRLEKEDSGISSLVLNVDEKKTISVDRKYVGNEVTFIDSAIQKQKFAYEIEYFNGDELVDKNMIDSLDFSSITRVESNSRLEIYFEFSNHTFQYVSVREKEKALPKTAKVYREYIVINNDLYKMYEKDIKNNSKYIDEKKIISRLQQNNKGINITIPSKVSSLVNYLNKNGFYDVDSYIRLSLINNKMIRMGLVKELLKIEKELKGEICNEKNK